MLKGSLNDFTLPDIFRLLSSCSKTGCIEVQRSAGQGKVFFREGEVYFAESTLTRDPLGQKLVRARSITEVQLRQALDAQAESGRRLGEVLTSEGVLALEQIEACVRQQIEDAVFDLLRWELGEFAWEPESMVDAEVAISVSVENLIMEASRKLEELEVITKKIPSEAAVLTMAPSPPDGAAEINITPEEWRILVLVNGTRSVMDIAGEVGLDNFAAMRILYGLAAAGLIEVIDAPQAPALEELAAALQDEAPENFAEEAPLESGTDPMIGPEHLVETEPEVESEPEPEVAPESEVAPEPDQVMESEADLEAEPAPSAAFEGDPDPFMDAAPDLGSDASDLLEPATEATEEVGIGENSNPFDIAPEEVSDIPISAEAEDNSLPTVDRLAAVRELADLFDQTEADGTTPKPEPEQSEESEHPEHPEQPELVEAVARTSTNGDGRRRVEDDEEITRGLISRLIDGVKGL